MGLELILIGIVLGAYACNNESVKRIEPEDGGADAYIPPDGGPTIDAGDGGIIPDGGETDAGDGGTTSRPGINDHFASPPCNGLPVDLDLVGSNITGICQSGIIRLFQCPTTNHLENSSCETLVELPAVVNDRQVTPTSHNDIGSGKSLITFTAQGANAEDTAIGLFIVDRAVRNILETFSFHSRSIIGGGGTITTTPISLNNAIVSQNKVFLATQSYYDVLDSNPPPILSGIIYAFPLTTENKVDTDESMGPKIEMLVTYYNDPINLIPRGDSSALVMSRGTKTNDSTGLSGSSIERIDTQSPANIVQSTSLGSMQLGTLPNVAIGENGDKAIMASSEAPWKLFVMDLANQKLLQEHPLPEITMGVASIVISGLNVFVTDQSGHVLWLDFVNGQLGQVRKDIHAGQGGGSSVFFNGILYQSVSAGYNEASGMNPRIVAIDPQQLE